MAEQSNTPRTGLRRSTAQAFVLRMATTGLGLIVSLVLARSLGDESFGVYTYTVSWAILLSLLAKLGLPNYAIRHVAQARKLEQWSSLRGFVRGASALAIGASITLGLALVAFSYLGGSDWSQEQTRTLRLIAVLLPLLVMVDLLQGMLRGLKQVVTMHIPTILRMAVLIVVVGIIALQQTTDLPAETAAIVHIAAAGVACLFGAIVLRNKMPTAAKSAPQTYDLPGWLRASLPMLFTAAMFNLVRRTDVLMIGILDDTTNAGKYFVASRIAEFTLVSAAAVNAMVAPTIAEHWAEKDHPGLQRLLRHAAKLSAGIMTAIVLLLVVASPLILRLYGPSFAEARTTLLVLMCAQVVSVAAGPVGFLMTMTGNERRAAVTVGITAVLNIALNATLIPRYGVEGAAAATAISTVVWNIALFVQVRDVLEVTPGVLGLLARSTER